MIRGESDLRDDVDYVAPCVEIITLYWLSEDYINNIASMKFRR